MRVRIWSWLTCCSLAFAVNGACSFKELDSLRSGRDEAEGGSGGSATGGSGNAGGSSGAGGAISSGGSAIGSGGSPDTHASGGDEAVGGQSESGGAPAGGETSSGGADGGSAGRGSEQGGSAGLGEAGANPLGGSSSGGSSTGGGMTYGVDGQSCTGEPKCANAKSCCRRIAVPAGAFNMGTNADPDALSDEKPPHSATLAAFALDEFEVTVSRMRRFVDAYDGTPPAPGSGANAALGGSGWQLGFTAELPSTRAALEDALNCNVGAYQTWTTQAGTREQWPINCVSWYVAFAFCIWDGGRLPTEAEWEKAGAGGSEERLYPWGSTAPDFAVHAVAGCRAEGSADCSPGDLLAVGSRAGGAGRWGHQDLAGSLWEWTLDHYDATYYQSIGTCQNCADLSALTPRVIRGGNFTSLARSLRATGRASRPPGTVDPYAGFRCAR